MSTRPAKQPPENDPSPVDRRKFELLDCYQQAIDAQDAKLRKTLRSAHPDLSELFSSLDQLACLATEPTGDIAGNEEATRTLNTAERLSTSTINLGHGPIDFGRYRLVEQIGRGGMGAVFRAQQPELNREVAVKVILSGELASDAELQRFQQEALSAAGLRHPNIVGIHDVGLVDGVHFLAMDYMSGGNLAARLRDAPPPIGEAVEYVRQIALAVEYLHHRGVIHRDLKPSNIVFDEEGRPCLTDFGLAKALQNESGLTRTGDVLGSASYMAPEQASGAIHQVSSLSDVYGLGAILYELLTGVPPFEGESFIDTVLHVIEREPTPLRRHRQDVPRELEQICLRCLEKSPEKRYPSAAALAEDLTRYQQGDPVEAQSVDVAQFLRRTVRRYPALTAHLAVLAAVSLIVAMRNWVVVAANPNYLVIEGLLAAWAGISLSLQRYQSDRNSIRWAQMIWAVLDPLFITSLIHLAEPPRATLSAAYLAFIAASGLWMRQSLVAGATLASLAGYVLLLRLHPEMASAMHHVLIFAALTVLMGLIVGFQVRRLRILNRYL